ncbi:hypothetical protein [Zavarzinia sp.]
MFSRQFLVAVIVVLLVGGGAIAYRAYEKDRETLQIDVGPDGLKITPPSK